MLGAVHRVRVKGPRPAARVRSFARRISRLRSRSVGPSGVRAAFPPMLRPLAWASSGNRARFLTA